MTPAALAADVARLRAGTESVFTRAGESLAAALNAFDALEGRVARIGDYAGAPAAVALAAAVGRLNMVSSGAAADIDAALTPLAAMAGVVTRMRAAVTSIKALLRVMRLLSIQVRILAATGTTGTIDIRAVAARVTAIAAELDEVGREIDARLSVVSGDTAAVGAGGATFRALFGARMVGVAERLGDDLAGFEAELGDLNATDGRLWTLACAVRGAVTTAVCGLQSGDALRQRLEHVETILAACAAADLGTAEAQAVAELGCRQLAEALATHREEAARTVAALRGAETSIAAFHAEVEVLLPAPGARGRALLDAVLGLEELFAGGDSLRRALGDDAARMTVGVERLTDAVARYAALGVGIRFIGFNAVIACASIGSDGDAMRCVAEELRRLARDAMEFRVLLDREAAALAAAWTSANARLDATLGRSRAEAEPLAGTIRADVTKLAADLTAELAGLTTGNSEIGAIAAEGAAALARHLDRVAALAATLGALPATPSTDPARLQPTATRLREILTMEAERVVHDAWASRCGLAAPQPATEDAAADIFF